MCIDFAERYSAMRQREETEMTKIGVRAHDYGKDTPERLFRRIRADGFSCAQLALKKAIAGVERPEDLTPGLLETVARAMRNSGVSTAVLGAYFNLALAEEHAREQSVDEFLLNVSAAPALEAVCVGTETTPVSAQPGVSRREALHCLYASLERILPQAERLGVTVALEPVFTHTVNTPEQMREVLETMRSPNLKVIFDPVNLLSAENIGIQRQLWERSFAAFGREIVAVHCKGVRRGAGGGLVSCGFGDSEVDYRYLFSRLRLLGQDWNLLREEIDPAQAAQDLAFLRSQLAG
jgi:sugar phosphate isomerase/epimerase